MSITLTHIVALTVSRRSMMPPPVTHHLPGDLAGIADRPRLRCDDLVSALARAALQIVRLIWAHAPATITRLAFLHYSLPDPIVRQMLQCLRLYTWKIRIEQWCLSVQRWSEREEQHHGRTDYRKQFHSAIPLAMITKTRLHHAVSMANLRCDPGLTPAWATGGFASEPRPPPASGLIGSM